MRLRDLETLLNEERRAREDAEERAARLERETNRDHSDAETIVGEDESEKIDPTEPEHEEPTSLENGSPVPPTADDTAARLQSRLDLMMSEMNEMKQQMERYRERAESAEANSKSLAEMIENIRKDNAKAASKDALWRSRNDAASAKPDVKADADVNEAEEGEITIIREEDLGNNVPKAAPPAQSQQNGHVVAQNGSKQSGKSTALIAHRLDRDSMYYGGPVGAMVTVVAIGVAVMAMLNQYPKGER